MTFGFYRKGSRAEHELIGKLAQAGFSVIRAAGSGVGGPCPDIVALRRGDQWGFECKAINDTSLQLRKEQVLNLRKWEENTSITTYVAWRLQGGEWRFIRLDHLHENPKSFAINRADACKFGLGVEELLAAARPRTEESGHGQ